MYMLMCCMLKLTLSSHHSPSGTIDPVSTTITNVTDSSISVDWKEPITNSSGVFFYDVKVSILDDKEREVPVLSTTTTETEITVNNLPSDTIVSVLIAAKVVEDNSTITRILPTVARVATTLPKGACTLILHIHQHTYISLYLVTMIQDPYSTYHSSVS